jgi:lysophospholipase L1-like esterase
MKQRTISILKYTLIYTVITFVLLEGLLWIMGYRPYANTDYEVHSTPKNPYVAHDYLGIQLNPGTYQFTLNKKVKFKATHLENNQRLISHSKLNQREKVTFLGCSYTYGYGVNDDESFAAITQRKHPEWKVENKAVVGYGTAQHLLQLREMLKQESPQCVILCLSSVHFIRTVLSQNYRANLRIGYRRSASNIDDRMDGARFPYFDDYSGKVKHDTWDELYSELPGRYWSASINLVQNLRDKSLEPKCNAVDITAHLIREMKRLCDQKGIPFGVICLDTNHETAALQQKLENVNWENVGFSFKSKKYTQLPYDSHPNAKGHKKIAQSVIPFIENLLKDE